MTGNFYEMLTLKKFLIENVYFFMIEIIYEMWTLKNSF